MQASSLIFLVIVAIWAAYLIQHWVRRREHVATARSVDRFSEAMRVLERRSPLPHTHLSAPHPRSYAVKPASSRPAVVVKRASAVQGKARIDVAAMAEAPLAARAASRAPRAAAGGIGGPGRLRGSGSGARPAAVATRSPGQVLARRIRGVAFLVTLGAIPVTFALSVAHVLLWVSLAIAVVTFAAVVAWLRHAVARERAARRQARSTARSRRAPRAAATTSATADAAKAAAAKWAASEPAAESSSGDQLDVEVSQTITATSDVFDNRAEKPVEIVAQPAAHQTSAADGVPGGWSPVPVPPPTYTLKDTATRAMPEPAEVTQTPVPIEVEDDDLERMAAEHHRRVVGG